MFVFCRIHPSFTENGAILGEEAQRANRSRHGRACPGHPRIWFKWFEDVDARDERGVELRSR